MRVGLLGLALLFLARLLPAQSILATEFGATPDGFLGLEVSPLGDVDGDGRADFLVGSFALTQIVSGQFLQVIGSVNGQLVVTTPDLNGGARFLRGSSTSGTIHSDQFQGHR